MAEIHSTDEAPRYDPAALAELLQQAQNGFIDLNCMAAGIAALIDDGDDGVACNLAHQLMKKAGELINVTDVVNIPCLVEGGAA